MSKLIKKVFVVYLVVDDGEFYHRVKKGYAEAGALSKLKWGERCIVRYQDGTIEAVCNKDIYDRFNDAEHEALNRDAKYDVAQAYYEDFLSCADASDFARMRECVGVNVGCEDECPF